MCSLLSLRTGSAGANIRFFPDDGRLSVSWELGRREWFNEAETSSPLAGFGLTPSSSGRTTPFAWIAPDRIASRASLLPPADAQLDVERTILIIDTFQPIRTTSHCWCYQEETEQTEDRVRLRGLRCLLFTPPGVRMPPNDRTEPRRAEGVGQYANTRLPGKTEALPGVGSSDLVLLDYRF